jgi:YVTN family beta-propeller protein
MDEATLRDLLERAAAAEPAMGPVARDSLQAGLRLRRRRRAYSTVACAAAVAVIGALVPAASGLLGHARTASAGGHRGAPATTLFVTGNRWVTPINIATGTPETPIRAPQLSGPVQAAITPNGKTAYIEYGPHSVKVVAVATDTTEKVIRVGPEPDAIAITPNGRTAYVAAGDGVTPINIATNTAGKPIKIGTAKKPSAPAAIAITPNGRTAYVVDIGLDAVTPINTATDTAGKPIKVGDNPDAIAITPNGETAYVANTGYDTVTPINTATDTPGKPIKLQREASPNSIAIAPDGQTAYVGSCVSDFVTAISTATNTVSTPIRIGRGNPAQDCPDAIAFTPDGQTAYVTNGDRKYLTLISTATNGVEKRIYLGKSSGGIVISPNGRTAYVATGDHTVTPVATVTNTPGKPINVQHGPCGMAVTWSVYYTCPGYI